MEFDIIDIRRFDAQEFAALLDSESRAWTRDLRWDFSDSVRIINACLRDKRLSGYALVRDGKVCGYCFFFYDGEKGVVGDLYIEPAAALGDHAQRLLDHALETLLATPGLQRVEAQLPHFEREELQSCFTGRGFRAYLRRFMSYSLVSPKSLNPPPKPDSESRWAREEIELVPWQKKFNHDAAKMLYDSYREHVDAMINDQYASEVGATRLIENIFHNQGCGEFLPHVSRMAFHRPTGRLAGILTVTRVRPATAHIPQVGVGPAFQGLGLGTAMMEKAFEELRDEGLEQVTLTVTDANSGAVRLYERLGFETFKTFGAFIFDRE